MRSLRVLLPLLALALLLPAPSSGVASAPLRLEAPLGENGWAAFRFNLSGGSDLVVRGDWTGCRNGDDGDFRSLLGVAWMEAQDGAPRMRLLAAGQMAWGGDVAEAGASGVVLRTPTVTDQPSCDRSAPLFLPGGSESLTVVVVSLAPAGVASVEASWTQGVRSWDVATGEARAWTKNGFGQGAHANVYPLVSAEAGALLSQGLRPERDMLGWFWPETPWSGPGATVWRCAKDGGACPAAGPAGIVLLSSKGPVSWDFAVDADARAGDVPYYVLGGVELPDGSWLR